MIVLVVRSQDNVGIELRKDSTAHSAGCAFDASRIVTIDMHTMDRERKLKSLTQLPAKICPGIRVRR